MCFEILEIWIRSRDNVAGLADTFVFAAGGGSDGAFIGLRHWGKPSREVWGGFRVARRA